jgi:transposase
MLKPQQKILATMFVKLTKKFITENLLPYLKQTHLGRKTKTHLWRTIKAIIYRLKTGTQWRELPLAQFGSRILMTWQSVFYHFNKWSKDGSWKNLWTNLLKKYKSSLDMSSVQFDGSHTPAKRGGEEVEYQGRKSCKTTNMLFLTDKSGMPLAISDPVSGNHHDLFEIEKQTSKMVADLELATISCNGLFLNADAGFDSFSFREFCDSLFIIANIDINKRNSKNPDYDYLLDEELYKERFSVERTNAWIDAFKAVLVRFETTKRNWKSLHYLTFSLILIRRVKPYYF